MQWLDNLVDKWGNFKDTPHPGLEKTGRNLKKTGTFLAKLWQYLYALRGLILSLPVAAAAVILAAKCSTDLPSAVMITLPGIDAQAENNLFGFLVYHTEYIARGTMVMACLAMTIACLLLTICSKRMLYPWLISLFTLAVPLFLLLTNVYL